TGHPHTSAGKAGAYSGTGGEKWETLATRGGPPDDVPAGLDSMFIDLSRPGAALALVRKRPVKDWHVGTEGLAPTLVPADIKPPNPTAWKYMPDATLSIRSQDAGPIAKVDEHLEYALRADATLSQLRVLKGYCHAYVHNPRGHNAVRGRAVQALYEMLDK